MEKLENTIFTLEIDSEHGYFSISPKDKKFPALVNAQLETLFTRDGCKCSDLCGPWQVSQTVREVLQSKEQGKIDSIHFQVHGNQSGIDYELTFGIVEEYPLLLWKVKLLNRSGAAVNMQRITMLKVTPKNNTSEVRFQQAKTANQMGFYHNGWQSWSPAGWVAGDGVMPHTHLGGLQAPMIYYAGTPRPNGKRGLFSSDFFAAVGDRAARRGFVLGFLAQKQQFGSIVADFRQGLNIEMWANGDNAKVNDQGSFETDWAVYNPILLDHRDPLEKYLEAVARENKVNVPVESPVGWCSWYHFYINLSAQDVEANLESIVAGQERLPVQLVQIDDGFEKQVGDWFEFKPTFKDGVAPLAEKIKQEGLIPGLWLAPFIVQPDSDLFHNHPDWMLRQKNGKFANAGLGWGKLCTGLDLTVPEALAYACEVVRKASADWGYPYLKLDFLYAAALDGRFHDPTKTRAQVLRMGMQAIRDAVGNEVTLLGCGAPFGSMLGLVEAMRIGPDVSGDWQPVYYGIKAFIKNEPSFPCARNSIHDILTRASLHGRWWVNDPDCLLIRPTTHLTLDEVKSLATVIGMTGGSLLLSDDLPKLPDERLRLAEVLLPILGERARVLDWFDAEMPQKLRLDLLNDCGCWHLLTLFNWQDQAHTLQFSPEVFDLPAGDYWLHEFWSGKTVRLSSGEKYSVAQVPAHGCLLIALRPCQSEPQYLGSDLHFSMGKEVAEWSVASSSVEMTLRLPRSCDGKITLALPWEEVDATINGKLVQVGRIDPGVFEIPVRVEGFCKVKVEKK